MQHEDTISIEDISPETKLSDLLADRTLVRYCIEKYQDRLAISNDNELYFLKKELQKFQNRNFLSISFSKAPGYKNISFPFPFAEVAERAYRDTQNFPVQNFIETVILKFANSSPYEILILNSGQLNYVTTTRAPAGFHDGVKLLPEQILFELKRGLALKEYWEWLVDREHAILSRPTLTRHKQLLYIFKEDRQNEIEVLLNNMFDYLGIVDGSGRCCLSKGKAYPLYGIITAIHHYSRLLLKREYTYKELLRIFNDHLGTSFVEFKKSKGQVEAHANCERMIKQFLA